MIPEAYRDLISLLTDRTERQEVNWKSTGDSTAFIVYLDQFSLVIRRETDDYGRDPDEVWIRLYDPDGEVIDSFGLKEDDESFDRLLQLHGSARRKALRIDEALSSIVEKLKESGPVGDEPPPQPKQVDYEDDLPF